MRVFIVYCHPDNDSTTRQLRDTFIEGLISSDIEYEISDLYGMDFRSDMTLSEYRREAYYNDSAEVPADVLEEQEKINRADGIVFIYPVFWTEAPSKLVGWFQRVWTYGYAYGKDRTMKQLERALFIVSMGGDLEDPVRSSQADAMRVVMLEDRINDRAKRRDMVFFDRTSRTFIENDDYDNRIIDYTQRAFVLGRRFFSKRRV